MKSASRIAPAIIKIPAKKLATESTVYSTANSITNAEVIPTAIKPKVTAAMAIFLLNDKIQLLIIRLV